MSRTTPALVLLILAATASAAPPSRPGLIDVDGTMPTIDDVAAAADRARAGRCRTPSCQAIEAVDQLAKMEVFMEDHVRMGDSRILYSEPAVWRWRRRALLDHAGLYPAFCATGARLLSRVSPTTGASDSVAATLLVAAVDVDLRSHGHCVRAMVAALPKSPATDKERVGADTWCRYDWHSRPWAACDKLVDGIPASELPSHR